MKTTLIALALLAAPAAAQNVVTSIAPFSPTPTPGVWYASNVTGAGTVSVVDLSTAGGNLQNNQPLPRGAARLTTTSNPGDRANIGLPFAYGQPQNIFPSLNIQYSWHKATNPGQDLTPAPSLKIAVFNPLCDDPLSASDCFGTFVYEASWNGPGSTPATPISSQPSLDTWKTVTIDENNGLFWWTGGFGQPSGAGGPPLKTLAQWRAVMSSDFQDAQVVLIEMGVGAGNLNQVGYVDDFRVSHNFGAGMNLAYDFDLPYSRTHVAVGTTPCDVIALDLSGDSKADIATADNGSNSVTVRFNSGTGTFPTSTTIGLTSGDAPSALAAGDLVVGGGRDLAVAATGNDAVRIVRNNPAGTFAVTASLSTLPATEPVGIDVGNLDGTGTDDIAVAMQGDLLIAGTGSVMVSLNGGALVALTPPAGGFKRPQRVAISDLDGDLDGDLIVTMSGSAFSPTLSANVLLYENLGAGAFAAPITLSVSQNPKGICSGDFDGDGDKDLAVTAESFPTILPGNVVVFKNTGLTAGSWNSGAFAAGGTFTGGSSPIDLECADLRDDSLPGFIAKQDVVAVNFGSENLTHYEGYNAGSNAFAAQNTLLAHSVPAALAIAHLDDDKTLDIVVANKASNDVTIMIAVTPSLVQPFGVGCAGTSGVPVISAVGSPFFGNPSFGVTVSNARSNAPALLGLSLNQFTTPLASCSLYLLPPLVLINTVTNGAGLATVTLPVPTELSGFAGSSAYFQYFIFDTAGGYNGQFAFSNALRIKVGN